MLIYQAHCYINKNNFRLKPLNQIEKIILQRILIFLYLRVIDSKKFY